MVQFPSSNSLIITQFYPEVIPQPILKELDLLGTNTIRSVVEQPVDIIAIDGAAAPKFLEGPRQFGIITLFRGHSILLVRVLACNEIV